jgi:Zn-dependent M28 family amino/carboxypeptidase
VRHPVIAPEALERAADYIKDGLESLGYETDEHHFVEDDRTYRNIIGLRRGTRYPDERVIVLAHYDTVPETPGANDNASGVAAMLELARVFQSLAFEASVLFVGVNLEEKKWGVKGQRARLAGTDHTLARGSKALAAHARANAWDIRGVITFDEIAYAGDSVAQRTPEGMPFELPQVGNFVGIIGNDHSKEWVEGFVHAIERYHIPLPCVPLVVPGNGQVLLDTRRSDHARFWDVGYKAIVVNDTVNYRTPHYHKASDTLETLNLDFATRVCRASGGLVIDMAGLADAQ